MRPAGYAGSAGSPGRAARAHRDAPRTQQATRSPDGEGTRRFGAGYGEVTDRKAAA